MSVSLSMYIEASNTSPVFVGSVWSPLAAVVMFVIVVPAVPRSTWASILSVFVELLWISPIFHIPDPKL